MEPVCYIMGLCILYIERGRKREKGEANSSLNEDLREKIEKSLQANRGPSSPHTPHILNCPVIARLRVFCSFSNQTNSFSFLDLIKKFDSEFGEDHKQERTDPR